MFYLFLREKAQAGWSRGRGGQMIWTRLHANSSEPNVGLKLKNSEIMTWAKVGQSTNRLSHPGAPEGTLKDITGYDLL